MFSNRHGLPNLTAFSRLLRKSLSESLITSRPASLSYRSKVQIEHLICSHWQKWTYNNSLLFEIEDNLIIPVLTIFLTHLLAWPWGSMKRGHRREYLTITPFSVDRLSLGSPAICQLRTLTGSDRVATRVGSPVRGTLFSSSFLTHSSCMSDLYFPYNGEKQ